MVGTSFADDYIATGYGEYLAMPLLRSGYRPTMTRDEARLLLERCMRVLFYRDARTINKVTSLRVISFSLCVGVATTDGSVFDRFNLPTSMTMAFPSLTRTFSTPNGSLAKMFRMPLKAAGKNK